MSLKNFARTFFLAAGVFAGGFCASAQGNPAAPLDTWDRQPITIVPPVKEKAPTIDGHVNFKEWYYAAAISGFYDHEAGGLGRYPATMYLCYDKDALYVGITISRPPLFPTPKSTFPAGLHPSIWWKDDNFELVMEPREDGKAAPFGYAFAGNSVGGYSDLRYRVQGAGSDAAWDGKWEYKAERGRDTWSAELKIPFSQFEGVLPPQPGTEWLFDALIQSVTPRKQLTDWAHMWSFGQNDYRSQNKARLIFGDANTPIFRQSQIGQMRPAGKQIEDKITPIGTRTVLYHIGDAAYTVAGEAVLYRADARSEGDLNFMDLWDRLRVARETGKPVTDPKETTQSFRDEASFLKEIHARYKPVATQNLKITVKPDGAGYFPLEIPKAPGDYIVAFRFRDAVSGKILSSQLTPFTIAPQFEIALTPYFLEHQKLRVDFSMDEIPGEATMVRARLKIGDTILQSNQAALNKENREEARLYLDTKSWPENANAQIEAELLDGNGKVLQSDKQSLTRPKAPSWWNQKLGMSPVVPPPFTPVESKAKNEVSVWGRRYQLGENGLPKSITTRGEELLSRPIELKATVGGKALGAGSTLARQSVSPRDAVFESTRQNTNLKMTTRTTTHYDGALRFDIQVAPAGKNIALDSLVLDIPMQARRAKLFTHGGTSTDFNANKKDALGGALETWFKTYPGGAMPFTYAFFLGGYDRGIQWFAPSDRGWSNADENKKIALIQNGDEVVLRVTFADKPFTLSRPLDLNFGLMVTPTKATPPRGRDLATIAYGKPRELREYGLERLKKEFAINKEAGGEVISSYLSDGDDIFGQPWVYNEEDRKLLQQIADTAHEAGLKYRPYSGWGVSANIPEFATFGKEMLKEPARNAGWGVFWHNGRSRAWADWWLAGAKDNATALHFNGMYLDGTVMPELTANELDDMGWRDEKGNLHGTYPVWALRDFLERLYILLHVEARKDGIVDVHDGHEPLYFINSFADTTVSGEYHLQRGKTILEVFSPEEFAAYYATHPQGNSRRFIWWNWMKLPISENEMRTMAILNDTMMVVGAGRIQLYRNQLGYGKMTDPWVRLRHLRERFADAEFVPYWKTTFINAAPEGLRTSAWVDKKNGRALVAIANLSTQDWKGALQFDAAKLGITTDAPIADAMFDLPLGYKASETLPLTIEGQSYRIFLLNDRFPIPAEPRKDGTEKTLPMKK
jgi:hypothetical protein